MAMNRMKEDPEAAKFGVFPEMTLAEFAELPIPTEPSRVRDEEFERSLIPGVVDLVRFLKDHPEACATPAPGLFVDTIGEGEVTASVVMVCLGEVASLTPDGKSYAMTTMAPGEPYSQPLTLQQFVACGAAVDPSAEPFVGLRKGVNGGPLVPFGPVAGKPMGRWPDIETEAMWIPGTLKRSWPLVYNALAEELGLPVLAPNPKTFGEWFIYRRPVPCALEHQVCVPVDSLLDRMNARRAERGLPLMRSSVDILSRGLSHFVPSPSS